MQSQSKSFNPFGPCVMLILANQNAQSRLL
jgi:hypothetical protein